jgi:hypothetical protein
MYILVTFKTAILFKPEIFRERKGQGHLVTSHGGGAHKGSLSIVLIIRNLGVGCTPAALPLEESPLVLVEETLWAPELVWAGKEKSKSLVPEGLKVPNHSGSGKSLYQLRYLSRKRMRGTLKLGIALLLC